MNFEDWKKFGTIPKNWKIVGGVNADWAHDDFLSTSPGTGVLVNAAQTKNSKHLVSGFEHGDIEVEFDYMVPKGSNSGIYLQGRYEVQIFDSWGKINPSFADAGGIYQRYDEAAKLGFEGVPPRMNVSKAPGLWQHFKIIFEAPRFGSNGEKVKNAKFVQVFHNGILVQENVEVTGPTRSALFEDERAEGPIMIQGDHGPVAIRDFKYKTFGSKSPEIKELRFSYFEGKFQSGKDFVQLKPNQTGNLDKITWDLGHGNIDFGYVYSGNLETHEGGEFTFSLVSVGNSSLYINGGEVLEDKNQFSRTVSLSLYQGSVPFKLLYHKNNQPGRRPQLGLFVEGPGLRRTSLHEKSSFVEPLPQKPIFVEPSAEPEIVRGFFQHGDKKKTHTVSVGEPLKTNYTVDLQQAALLGIWRGGFLNTAPMWRQRGESQLMIPNGGLIELSGRPSIAKLESQDGVWPDSLTTEQLQIQGYFLRPDRRPVFKYVIENIAIEDSLEPEDNGKFLSRTISYDNPNDVSNVWVRVVSGENIEMISTGVYIINNGQYYIKIAEDYLNDTVLRENAGGKELLIPINTESAKIKYSLIW
ncbi:MAG TPA: family 16 glycoside hydrolase [Lunatimonas sp.]|nr:family 16 glycoside hydrolase [Lunatimonas sp.]